MGQTRQELDEKFLGQVRDTEDTILDHLKRSPDDFRALVMADFIAEVFAECDPRTRGHAQRFQETRRALGETGYVERARAAGLEPLLLSLWRGLRGANFGRAAWGALAHRLIAVTDGLATLHELHREAAKDGDAALTARCLAAMKKKDPAGASGKIDASYLPEWAIHQDALTVEFYGSGHLRFLKFRRDGEHHGTLELDEKPGSGRFYLRGKRGGYGYAHEETYRAGQVHLTFYSPWHDGAEASEKKPWTEWVSECIGSILQAAGEEKPKKKGATSKKAEQAKKGARSSSSKKTKARGKGAKR
jgi:hypothetical protein